MKFGVSDSVGISPTMPTSKTIFYKAAFRKIGVITQRLKKTKRLQGPRNLTYTAIGKRMALFFSFIGILWAVPNGPRAATGTAILFYL